MSSLVDFAAGLQAAQSSEEKSFALGGNRISQVLELLSILNELQQIPNVDFSSPAGIEQLLAIGFNVAARAASLSDTTVDDEWVAKIRQELQQPEVVAFVAYLVRRVKQ